MKTYVIDADTQLLLSELAYLVLTSKQNVGQKMKTAATVAADKLDKLEPVPAGRPYVGCKLDIGEECLMCGAVGSKKRRATKARPVCQACQEPFTRKTPWRLLRGRRLHIACIP